MVCWNRGKVVKLCYAIVRLWVQVAWMTPFFLVIFPGRSLHKFGKTIPDLVFWESPCCAGLSGSTYIFPQNIPSILKNFYSAPKERHPTFWSFLLRYLIIFFSRLTYKNKPGTQKCSIGRPRKLFWLPCSKLSSENFPWCHHLTRANVHEISKIIRQWQSDDPNFKRR